VRSRRINANPACLRSRSTSARVPREGRMLPQRRRRSHLRDRSRFLRPQFATGIRDVLEHAAELHPHVPRLVAALPQDLRKRIRFGARRQRNRKSGPVVLEERGDLAEVAVGRRTIDADAERAIQHRLGRFAEDDDVEPPTSSDAMPPSRATSSGTSCHSARNAARSTRSSSDTFFRTRRDRRSSRTSAPARARR
jgi:hypothetical protein